MEPYDSGPGRKWLFFLFGAGVFATLALAGVHRHDRAAFQLGRLLAVGAFALAAWRAHHLRVTADDEGVTVRTWAQATRYAWADCQLVGGTPERPLLVLRDGTEVVLLDSWHHDPHAVAVEVRRRLAAARERPQQPRRPA